MKSFIFCISLLALNFLLIKGEGIKFKSSIFSAPVSEVYYCGENDLIVLTTEGLLYKSTDQGITFLDLEEKFFSIFKEVKIDIDFVKSNIGIFKRIHQSSADKKFFIIEGSKEYNFVTSDCGSTFSALQHFKKINQINLHPNVKEFILLTSWKECLRTEKDCIVNNELHLSVDMGRSWIKIQDFVTNFEWLSSKTNINDKTSAPTPRIIFSQDQERREHQQLMPWKKGINLYYSDDFGQIHKHWLYVSVIDDFINSRVSLWISRSEFKKLKLKMAQIPIKFLPPAGFTILSDSKETLILYISNYSTDSPFGTLYISDKSLKFTEALQNIVRNSDRIIEYQRIMSLKSVFISNSVESQFMSMYDSKKIGEYFKMKDLRWKSYEKHIRTLISVDFGAMWQNLKYNGDKKECKGECHLHLNLNNKPEYGNIHTRKEVHSLSLATGNYGKYLETNIEKINTYISRDAGYSWDFISKGSNIYEFGKHGDIIVMVDNVNPTNTIMYSSDHGKNFQPYKLDNSFNFVSISLDKNSENEMVFFLQGIRKSNDEKVHGQIFRMDFSGFFNKTCQGYDEVEKSGNSDYEYWTPFSGVECYLGEKEFFVKRKADSICRNNQKLEALRYKKPCECTEKDWECDKGYHRTTISSPCVAIKSSNKDFIAMKPPTNCKEFYFISSGYRRIPGTNCEGGVFYSDIPIPCPNKLQRTIRNNKNQSINQSISFFILLTLIIILIWLAIALRDKIKSAGEDFYRFMEQKFFRRNQGYHFVGNSIDPTRIK